MNKTITFLVDKNNDNMRLDKYLVSKLKKITRSQIKKIIIDKNVVLIENMFLHHRKKSK